MSGLSSDTFILRNTKTLWHCYFIVSKKKKGYFRIKITYLNKLILLIIIIICIEIKD